jgi:hypothetical protein
MEPYKSGERSVSNMEFDWEACGQHKTQAHDRRRIQVAK